MIKKFSDITSKDYDPDEEITGDNIEDFNTLSPLEATPEIMEFTDVSHKDSTLILPEVTLHEASWCSF